MSNNEADKLKTHLHTLSATNYTGNTIKECQKNSEKSSAKSQKTWILLSHWGFEHFIHMTGKWSPVTENCLSLHICNRVYCYM